MRRIPRPTPSMAVACLALAVALSGTAVAASVAVAPNSVGTAQLKNNAVTTTKVKNGTLLAADFKAGQLKAGPTGPAGAAGAAGPAGPAGAAGAAGPAGPSDAYARFLNGPIAIPAAVTTLTNLSIPQAGKYVLWAKALVTSTTSGVATCQLVAGTDLDQTQSYASTTTPFTLSNLVVHEFAAAGTVEFKCGATAATLSASWIKLAAIRVGNLTNTG